MKKYILLFLIFGMILLSYSNISAFFFWSHEKFTIQGFDDVSSLFTEMCKPYLSLCVDANEGQDSGVVFYTDSNDLNRKSYIFTHTLQALNICKQKAGSDISSKCYCYCAYGHSIQDAFSHGATNIDGITQKTLAKFFGNNYLGHMTVERFFENTHKEIIKKENPSLYQRVNDADKKVMNNLMITDSSGKLTPGGKYLDLLNSMAGIDMGPSVDAVRRGYLGVGFYDTVYKDKVSLPLYPFILIPSIMIGLSLIIIVLLLIFGRGRWKWFSIFLFVIVLLSGSYVFYSFWTGNSWKVITKTIEIPPKFGYLSLSTNQVKYYDKLVQNAYNEYLKDPDNFVKIQDASGLSYKDINGNWVKGTLAEAESGYKYFLFPILSFLIILYIICLMFRSFRLKPTNKFLNSLISFIALVGTIIFFILMVMIIYGVFF